MALHLIKHAPSPNWFLKGSVRGIHVHESTRTDNDEFAETVRVVRERELQMKGAIRCARERLEAAGEPIANVSPYTARHTVSTQLVINGVHPHIKDQIVGHAVDDMSRNYTNVPQAPLIEAINTLPVPAAWREMSWWSDPVSASRLQFGRGAPA